MPTLVGSELLKGAAELPLQEHEKLITERKCLGPESAFSGVSLSTPHRSC